MARLRGDMKRPFRIRKNDHHTGKGKQAMTDDILGEDIHPRIRNRRPKVPITGPVRRTGNDHQKQKYLERIVAEKKPEPEVQLPAANLWAGAQPQQIAPHKPTDAAFLSSAYSYNPDRSLLHQAQKQAAMLYAAEDSAALKLKINEIKFRRGDYLKMSGDAFAALSGQTTEAAVDADADHRTALKEQLNWLEQLKSQMGTSSQLDELVQFQTQMMENRAKLEIDLKELEDAEAHILSGTKTNRERATAFESAVMQLREEQQVIRKLLNVYKEKPIFTTAIHDYALPLEGELRGTLRGVSTKSSAEEQFVKMKRQEQFDNKGVVERHKNILKVKRYVGLRK